MDLFDKLKAAWRPRSSASLTAHSWAEALVLAYERESAEAYTRANPLVLPKPGELDAGRQILARDRADWIEILAAALVRLQRIDEERTAAIGPNSYTMAFFGRSQPLAALVTRLLRAQLPFSAERFSAIAQYCVEHVGALRGAPLGLLLRQAEHIAGGQAASGPLAAAVEQLSRAAASPPRGSWKATSPEAAELARRLLAGESKAAPILKASAWRQQVMAEIKALPTDAAAAAWRAIEQALEAEGKTKPTQAFLAAARALLTEHASLAAQILGWIEAYTPEPPNTDPNEDTIRGMIWLLAASDAEKTTRRLGDYGELCFKKLPNIGARSVKLGNGVIQTLALLGGSHAIAELTRLKKRVRYPAVVERIEAALANLAVRSGMDRDEMEELSLPTYELSRSGERRLAVADGAAILRLRGKEVDLTWQRGDGREMASVPKSLQDADAEGVKRARALRKDIEATLAGQAARLEALYLADRRMPIAAWRERYRDHPLLADLTARLLWVFDSAGKSVTGLPRSDAIKDAAGRSLPPPDDAIVRLWHPLEAGADEIGTWREHLAALQITQPFKQAHRETYVLTDAERQTNLYSNRFAAHILRQHQFKALCDQRGWRYRLMGPWDSHNTPTRAVPRHALSVEFWVDHVESGERQSGAVYGLIATDQVRFVRGGGTAVALGDVSPLVFSELMRDVDLFVGVASVGTDPDWMDGGPDRRFGAYWREFAFGAIGESGKARKLALEALLPRLAIGRQCTIEDRFLVVHGKLGTYKIHLGSGNILMLPDDRYLCIVPARGKDARFLSQDRLVLPFEGDLVLSVVLSKAFLLAADDSITDPSILSQIRRA